MRLSSNPKDFCSKCSIPGKVYRMFIFFPPDSLQEPGGKFLIRCIFSQGRYDVNGLLGKQEWM